ncbi:hypothetical protein D9758_004265 [Tetrapyrgos nigripes]|uniref:F-box domain-containing protein n=1 Tax=Tetrapyrgos nigripes TaxID=182062 RepID=A0A8H5GUH2_9AGAR|nr:hypothetical protein D9758_004265 [Tetrapyrgos nigripes]
MLSQQDMTETYAYHVSSTFQRKLHVATCTSHTIPEEHQPFFPAVLKLPVELITEIFMLFFWDIKQEEEVDESWSGSFGRVNALVITESEIWAPSLVLSQICSRWRAVAFSVPILWSQISVNLSNNIPGVGYLTLLYLHNSAPKKLILDVTCSNFDENGDRVTTLGQEGWTILHGIFTGFTSSRWQHVRLDLNHAVLEQFTERLLHARIRSPLFDFLPTDSLESLVLQWDTFYGPISDRAAQAFSKFFTASPTLRTLTLDLFDHSLNGFPYHQLTDLTVNEDSNSDILQLLAQCPNLQSLSIPCQSIQTMVKPKLTSHYNPGHSNILTFPHLEALTIKPLVCYPKASWIISNLSLPNLHFLDLQTDVTLSETHRTYVGMRPSEFWVQTVRALLWRSSLCHGGKGLRHLRLTGFHFNDWDLLQILAYTPNLRQLEIDAMWFYEKIFTRLFFEVLTVPWSQPFRLELPFTMRLAAGPDSKTSELQGNEEWGKVFLHRLTALSLRFSESNMAKDDFTLLIDRYHDTRTHDRTGNLPHPDWVLSMLESRTRARTSVADQGTGVTAQAEQDRSAGTDTNSSERDDKSSGWTRLQRFELWAEVPIGELRDFKNARDWKDQFRAENSATMTRMRDLQDRLDLRVTIED